MVLVGLPDLRQAALSVQHLQDEVLLLRKMIVPETDRIFHHVVTPAAEPLDADLYVGPHGAGQGRSRTGKAVRSRGDM